MLLVYVTCKDEEEASKIAKVLLEKKLCACTNISANMKSMYFWPSESNKIEASNEVVLLVKTITAEFEKLANEVKKIHSYEIPCIFGTKVDYIDDDFEVYVNKQIK